MPAITPGQPLLRQASKEKPETAKQREWLYRAIGVTCDRRHRTKASPTKPHPTHGKPAQLTTDVPENGFTPPFAHEHYVILAVPFGIG